MTSQFSTLMRRIWLGPLLLILVAPFSVAVSAFGTALRRELGESVDFFEVPLELARFADSDGEGPLSGFVELPNRDNGPVIPDTPVDRLLEPLYTTKANGMGTGLPVPKTIVEAHKGRIWAWNRPEGGACFCFTAQKASTAGPSDD